MSSSNKYTKTNIELRRAEVFRLLAKGHTQRSISEKLGCSPALVSLDVQFLHQKAREELRFHLSDKLPFEYSRALAGINSLLLRASEMLERTTEPRMELQTMTLLMQLYGQIMTLATDGGIIQEAMKKVKTLSQKNSFRDENNPETNVIEDNPLTNQFANTEDEETETEEE